MAYTTGTNIASLTAFLTTFMSFAAANAGFTDLGATATNMYQLSKDGLYYTFRVETATTGALTHNKLVYKIMLVNSSTPSQFTNTAYGSRGVTSMSTYTWAGPFPNYWLFTDGEVVSGIIEITTGVFTHISIGRIARFGTWAGGHFVSGCDFGMHDGTIYYQHNASSSEGPTIPFSEIASPWPGNNGTYVPTGRAMYVHSPRGFNNYQDFAKVGSAVVDGQSAKFSLGEFKTLETSKALGTNTGLYAGMLSCSTAFGRALLLPIYCSIYDYATATGYWRLAGYVPNVALVNMTDMYPGQVVTSEDGNWQVFPVCSLIYNPTVHPVTGPAMCIAYKQVA